MLNRGEKGLQTFDGLELCFLTHGRMEGKWAFDNIIKSEIATHAAGPKLKPEGKQ